MRVLQHAPADVTLIEQVLDHVETSCHRVNQMLLLEELHRTRVANPLLVPEADEDVKWTHDGVRRGGRLGDANARGKNVSISGEEYTAEI